jgi:DNA relaxase NicK
VTRIDCALDDRAMLVPITTVLTSVNAGHCVTRAERMQIIESGLIHQAGKTGKTLYFGSPQSQTMLRIYDKRLELQAKQREDWQAYGIRWELELKKERAQVCAQCLVNLDETDWREFLVGVLRSYVDFRITTREASDEERYRAPLVDWYAELTEGFMKGRLVVEKDEQTLPKVKRWVSESVAPMLAVICASPDGQAWLEYEIVEGVDRWKERHRRLLKKPKRSSPHKDAGGNAAAPIQGGEGVS